MSRTTWSAPGVPASACPRSFASSSAPQRAANRAIASCTVASSDSPNGMGSRSEEHTSELQSLAYLVCRLLLEKKNYIVQELLISLDKLQYHRCCDLSRCI